ITVFPGVREANVYGVSVAGRDGRAGMAALVVDPSFDLAAFRDYLAGHLPDYARPLFLRILPELDHTTTFKQKKIGLVRDGFNPPQIGDVLYFNAPQARAFVRVDPPLYQRIQSGELRV